MEKITNGFMTHSFCMIQYDSKLDRDDILGITERKPMKNWGEYVSGVGHSKVWRLSKV